MTPLSKLITAKEGVTLSEANDIIWEHKLNSLPILDNDGRLVSFVFRKDYDEHKSHPLELLDDKKKEWKTFGGSVLFIGHFLHQSQN